jgi:hexosaminidase
MNVLHLHISDTASFPLELKRQPNVTAYGAYGPKYVYTPDMVQRINEVALLHGVVVIPEIDAPAHVGAGWEWGAEAGNPIQ